MDDLGVGTHDLGNLHMGCKSNNSSLYWLINRFDHLFKDIAGQFPGETSKQNEDELPCGSWTGSKWDWTKERVQAVDDRNYMKLNDDDDDTETDADCHHLSPVFQVPTCIIWS